MAIWIGGLVCVLNLTLDGSRQGTGLLGCQASFALQSGSVGRKQKKTNFSFLSKSSVQTIVLRGKPGWLMTMKTRSSSVAER